MSIDHQTPSDLELRCFEASCSQKRVYNFDNKIQPNALVKSKTVHYTKCICIDD